MSNEFEKELAALSSKTLKSQCDELERLFNFGLGKGLESPKYGTVSFKKDGEGFILDPLDDNLKCGWGATVYQAFLHLRERNSK